MTSLDGLFVVLENDPRSSAKIMPSVDAAHKEVARLQGDRSVYKLVHVPAPSPKEYLVVRKYPDDGGVYMVNTRTMTRAEAEDSADFLSYPSEVAPVELVVVRIVDPDAEVITSNTSLDSLLQARREARRRK